MGIRVALNCWGQFLRDSLASVLDSEPDIMVVGCTDNLPCLSVLIGDEQPDVVVLEFRAANRSFPRGLDALHRAHPQVGLVGFELGGAKSHGTEPLARAPIALVPGGAGATGLVEVIRSVADGEGPPPGADGDDRPGPRASRRGPGMALSERQRQILRRISEGATAIEIAKALDISVRTVHSHKQRIVQRLRATNQAHAVSLAIRHGVLSEPSLGALPLPIGGNSHLDDGRSVS